ncbi:MAG: hypothetical protein J6M35_07100 [Clostridia bacterium]|nr:hypothetical protein [Clostridia bacterium]
MKSYDETISAVFDRIRTNEIEKQRKRKMALKLITSLGCLCLVVAVCVGVWNIDFSSRPGDEKTPVEENKNEENKPIEYIFLCSSGQSSSSKVTGFVPIDDSYFNNFTETGSEVYDELDGKKKTLFEGSVTLVYDHSEGIYDVYVGEDGSKAKYLHGTDIITCYDVAGVSLRPKNKTMEAAECKQIADKFISNMMSPKEFSRFNKEVFVAPFAGIDGIFAYHYALYIEGYATKESIDVVVTGDGEVYAYVAHNFGKYDTLKSKLTKEKLDAAYEKLVNKIEELELTNLFMYDPMIVTKTSGEVFLEMLIEYYDDEGVKGGDYVYVNILNLQ